jgi:hypothetical protein
MPDSSLCKLVPETGGFMSENGHIAVRNCPVRFYFQCSRKWDDLETTDRDEIRFCHTCQENVHLCETDAEMVDHARKGHCVAKFLRDNTVKEDDFGFVIGRPEKGSLPFDKEYGKELAKNSILREIAYSPGDCPECGFPLYNGLYGVSCLLCEDLTSTTSSTK